MTTRKVIAADIESRYEAPGAELAYCMPVPEQDYVKERRYAYQRKEYYGDDGFPTIKGNGDRDHCRG